MTSGESKENEWCAWRNKAKQDSEESRWKEVCSLERIEKKDLYFKNAMAAEVLEELIGYRDE